MKMNAFRILTICMVVLMLIGIGVSAAEAVLTTESKDGIIAELTTDKSVYADGEPVRINLSVTNNTGKRVSVTAQVQTPNGFETANGTTEAMIIEAGQTEKMLEASMTVAIPEEVAQAQNKAMVWIWIAIVLAVLVIAAGVFLFIYGKNKRTYVSMLLCLIMLSSLILGVAPKAEASRNNTLFSSSFVVSKTVTVVDAEVTVPVLVSYDVGVADPMAAPEDPTPDTKPDNNGGNTSNEPDNRLTAFYFNDFQDSERYYGSDATVVMQNHWFDKETNGDNTYLKMEILESEASGYIQADLKNNRMVSNLVFTAKLSTDADVLPGMYMQYRYCTSTNYVIFWVNQDGTIQICGQTQEGISLEAGKWLEMTYVFDFASDPKKDTAEVYVNGEFLGKFDVPKREENYKIPYMRISFSGSSGKIENTGKSLLVDDVAIYESDKVLPLSEIKSPVYAKWNPATKTKDVAMEYPELAELGDEVVAVLAGTDQAYINGEVVTLPEVADATYVGNRVTDAMVSGQFLNEYLGISGLASGKHSLLRYAAGWNIFADSRGLIILTKGVELDENEDIDLVTMLYGYLQTGTLVNNYAISPAWTKNILDEALNEPMAPWPTFTGVNYPALRSTAAMYYLILATYLDENAAGSDGRLCRDSAVERLRFLIAGGNEPFAFFGCYWGHGTVSSAVALAKNTPAVWNQLTEEEIAKLDLLMECLAIAANWGYNEQNDYGTGFNLLGNVGKNHGPNFRNAYVTCYFSASMYFGAEEVDQIFLNFDYDKYIERIKAANFTCILQAWTTKDVVGVSIGEYMTNGGDVTLVGYSGSMRNPEGYPAGTGAGVKLAWALEDTNSNRVYHAGELLEMFIDQIEYTYEWQCQSESRTEGVQYWSHTKTGAKSPWEGQMGMMTEFSGHDSGGTAARSKALYCYLSMVNIMPLYANMKLLGYWDYDSQTETVAQRMLEMDRRIMVGTEDLLFKIHEGYIGWANQSKVEETEDKFNRTYGLGYFADIWRNFHAMGNTDIKLDVMEVPVVLAPAADPKDGVTTPSADAILPQDRDQDQHGRIHPGNWRSLGGNYLDGSMEFDVTIGPEVDETDFSSIILIDRAVAGKGLSDVGMLINFMDGYISVYNVSGYKETGLPFGRNYRFHITVSFDVKAETYSVKITQTWPETKKEVSYTASNNVFRLGSSNHQYIDSITVSGPKTSRMWVENVKMTSGTKTTHDRAPANRYSLTIKSNWDGVPKDKIPESVTVRLVMNGTPTARRVTLTKADGWAPKVFDDLPFDLNMFEVEWSIIAEKIDDYYAYYTDVVNDSITFGWIEDSLFVDEDFEDGFLNTLVDEGTIYPDMTTGVLKEENGNTYMLFEDDGILNQLRITTNNMVADRVLTGKYNNVIMQMDLKLLDANQVINGHINYRRENQEGNLAAYGFIVIRNNAILFTDEKQSVNLGMLTEQWQTLKIWYDAPNNTMMVCFGEETNFALKTTMAPIASNEIRMNISSSSGALCVDNVLAYCDSEWTMAQNLATMKTAVDVKVNWDGITSTDSVVAKLYADGVDTGKTITLNPGNGWTGRFTNLKKFVNGMNEIVYTVKVPDVAGYQGVPSPVVGNLITVTYTKKINFYEDDFNDKDYGEIKGYVNAQLGILGTSGQHWIHMGGENGGTYEISNELIYTVPNLVMEMKLKIDADHAGTIQFRYGSKGPEGDKTSIFFIYANGDMRTGSALSTTFKTLTVDEWVYLKVIMNFENQTMTFYDEEGNVLAVKKNLVANTGNFVRFWADTTASVHVDDLKIYCLPVAGGAVTPPADLEEKAELGVKVDWADMTPAASVTVNLLADGVATGKTLTLSAAGGWSGKFTGLKKYSNGTAEINYTVSVASPADVRAVISPDKGGYMLVTFANELVIYQDNFNNKDAGTLKPYGFDLIFEGTNGNNWLVLGGGKSGTSLITDDRIYGVSNLVLEMKIRMDAAHTGTVHFSYNSTGPDNDKTMMFGVYSNGNLRTGSATSSTFKTLIVDQWMYLRVVLDFESKTMKIYDENGNVLATKQNIYVNDGDTVRIWASNDASIDLDDLKIYSQPQALVAPVVTTNRNVNVVWDGITPPASVELELLADGVATGKKLTLNAANGWSGTFADIPMYNDSQVAVEYSVKAPTVAGANAVISSDGAKQLTVSYSDKTYYYQDDFNDRDWGIFKTFGTVSFDGAGENYWMKYENNTSTITLDEAVLTADNLVIEMKLMVADDHASGIEFRYDSNGSLNANTPFLALNSDKDLGLKYYVTPGPRGSFYTLTANQWTSIKVVLDFVNNTCTYYDGNGQILATKTNIDKLDGTMIKMWSDGASPINIDDLKIYSIN